jgi:hypothetical protein
MGSALTPDGLIIPAQINIPDTYRIAQCILKVSVIIRNELIQKTVLFFSSMHQR